MVLNKIYQGDSLQILKTWPDSFVHCVVTSPPYLGLRDYGVTGQLGLEKTPDEYILKMVEVFREIKRVLRSDGTIWVNMGDSYAAGKQGRGDIGRKFSGTTTRQNGSGLQALCRKAPIGLKPKDLVGIPWMLAFALRADGWYLRSDIIWAKPNPMPESVTDRPTKAHEYLFLLSKSQRYYYDQDAIKEKSIDPESSAARYEYKFTGRPDIMMPDGNKQQIAVQGKREFDGLRNKRSWWIVSTNSFDDSHFATFPENLIKPCILAGCMGGGLVLDPFMGAGTTGLVAAKLNRKFLGIELNPKYIEMAECRIAPELAQGKFL